MGKHSHHNAKSTKKMLGYGIERGMGVFRYRPSPVIHNYRTCTGCGAHLDFGERCEVCHPINKKAAPGAANTQSGKEKQTGSIVPNGRENVK